MFKKILSGTVLVLFAVQVIAQVNNDLPPDLKNVDIVENLGKEAALKAKFLTSDSTSITLNEILEQGKPIILNPVYYECPMLCTLVLNGLLDGVKSLGWNVGNEFIIVTFSIDPNEGPALAKANKNAYLEQYGRPGADEGWYFLTGSEENIRNLTNSIGFGFAWDEFGQQWAHGAAITFLTPDGKISRYLYGIEFSELDLKNAIGEASEGTIGSTLDRLLLYCYQYDPAARSYVPHAINIMKVGGLLTLSLVGSLLGFLWYREHSHKESEA